MVEMSYIKLIMVEMNSCLIGVGRCARSQSSCPLARFQSEGDGCLARCAAYFFARPKDG